MRKTDRKRKRGRESAEWRKICLKYDVVCPGLLKMRVYVYVSTPPWGDIKRQYVCSFRAGTHTHTQTRSHQSAYPLYRAVFTEGDGAWNAFGLPGTRWGNAHTYAHSKGGLISSALLGFIDTLGNHSLISPQRKEKYTDYMNVCEKEWEEETERMMGKRKREWGSSFTSEMGNVRFVITERIERKWVKSSYKRW